MVQWCGDSTDGANGRVLKSGNKIPVSCRMRRVGQTRDEAHGQHGKEAHEGARGLAMPRSVCNCSKVSLGQLLEQCVHNRDQSHAQQADGTVKISRKCVKVYLQGFQIYGAATRVKNARLSANQSCSHLGALSNPVLHQR